MGVKMDVRGVLVVGLEEIEGEDGTKVNPGLLSGLQIGDIIMTVNGTEVYRADEVQELINEAKGTVRLRIKRNEETLSVDIDPVKSKKDGVYRLGIWVKDKTCLLYTSRLYSWGLIMLSIGLYCRLHKER